MKKLFWLIGITALIVVVVILCNLLLVQVPVNKRLREDQRNNGILIRAHFKNYVVPKTLVFNVMNISQSSSPADVFRTFLVTSSVLQKRIFKKVELASRGESRFYISGDYFNTLGIEYGEQNVVYTMRTFPENLFLPDGKSAYSSWTGGVLGVLTKQMEDFNDMCQKWFIEDFK